MAISDFYLNSAETRTYSDVNITGTATISMKTSDYYTTLRGTYDNSNIYTMCVDDALNCISYVTDVTARYNRFSATSNLIPEARNAIFYGISDNEKTLQRTGYTSAGRYSGQTTRVATLPNLRTNYIVPYIAVLEKSKLNDDYAVTGGTMFNSTDVKRVTLKELMDNKDNYYVTDIQLRPVLNSINTTSSNRWYLCYYNQGFITDNGFSAINTAAISNNYFINLHSEPWEYNNISYYVGRDGEYGAVHNNYLWYTVDTEQKSAKYIIYPFPENISLTSEEITDGIHYHTYNTNGSVFVIRSIKNVTGVSDSIACKLLLDADWVIKKIASFGIYVLYNNTDITNIGNGEIIDSPYFALGEMNNEGFTTGVMLRPSEIPDSDTKQKNWHYTTEQTINPNNYKPVTPDTDNIEKMHARSFAELTGFIKYYKMTRAGLDDFINACQEAGKGNVGFEYMPYINTVMQYPFDVLNYISAEDHSSTIKINGVTLDGSYITPTGTSATGKKLTSAQLPINNIGTTKITRKYNNFLDYAPYTTIEVYIPFCDFVTLPTHCMGKDIQVLLIMDIINGTCKGEVYCDGIIVAEKNGTCGRTVALSGIETGLRNASVISSASGIASSALGLASGIATGNPVSVGYSAVSGIGAISQTMATLNNSYTRTTGNYGDNTNFHDSSCCYLKITRPVCHVPASYGKNVGYICNKTKQLVNCKGYTVVENPELNLNCNYDEETEIKNLLQTGVIIK